MGIVGFGRSAETRLFTLPVRRHGVWSNGTAIHCRPIASQIGSARDGFIPSTTIWQYFMPAALLIVSFAKIGNSGKDRLATPGS